MTGFLEFVLAQGYALSVLEVIAVILAIAYLLLAVKQNILCWYCALFSTAVYIHLFWNVNLLMESALNVFYLIMAVYGWYEWKYGGNNHHGVQIHRLGLKKNALVILTVLILTLISGTLLTNNTQAAWPYVDSFTTWGSVVTTIMVTRKILDNWLYWFVIDGISIPLYLERELYLTALLFVLYLVIVVFGYFSWSKQFSQEIISNESEVSNHA